MRAVVLTGPGGSDRLEPREVESPRPRPAELLVRVGACGVCGHDLLARRGALGTTLPQILGHEIAGEVVDAASGTGFSVGDRVVLNQRLSCGACAACRAGRTNVCVSGLGFYGEDLPGGYAELVRALPTNAVRLPPDMSYEVAAALPCGVATGYHALRRLRVTAGETVLVVGATGGVGVHAVALAAHLGADVVAVVRSEDKAQVVRDAGASRVVIAGPRDFHRALREVGAVPDAVVECVGGPTLDSSIRAVRSGGRLAILGNVDPSAAVRLGMLILKEVDVLGSSHATTKELAECVELVATGSIVPRVRALPLGDAPLAHDLVESGAATAKVVLVP